jgi:hypothetical protein
MDGRIVGSSYVQSRVEVAACKPNAQNGLPRKLRRARNWDVGIVYKDNGSTLRPPKLAPRTAIGMVAVTG